MIKAIFIFVLTLELYAAQTHKAKVLESLNSGGYSYIKVQEAKQSYWIAMTERALKVGDTISFSEQGWMNQFHSKTLNRTFEKILFAADTQKPQQQEIKLQKDIMNSSYQLKDTITVAQLFKDRSSHAGKKVQVRGKVTKVSAGIMKRNWVHLQDGSRFQNADDLVFTSNSALPEVGSIIVAQGTVAKDKDFGYGYFYPVIVEESSFTKSR